jgi:hypothetical protein
LFADVCSYGLLASRWSNAWSLLWLVFSCILLVLFDIHEWINLGCPHSSACCAGVARSVWVGFLFHVQFAVFLNWGA